MPEVSLKDKTVRGVGWSAIDNVAQYAVQFFVGIVLYNNKVLFAE